MRAVKSLISMFRNNNNNNNGNNEEHYTYVDSYKNQQNETIMRFQNSTGDIKEFPEETFKVKRSDPEANDSDSSLMNLL